METPDTTKTIAPAYDKNEKLVGYDIYDNKNTGLGHPILQTGPRGLEEFKEKYASAVSGARAYYAAGEPSEGVKKISAGYVEGNAKLFFEGVSQTNKEAWSDPVFVASFLTASVHAGLGFTEKANYVFRAIRPDEVLSIQANKGIMAKNPSGTWTLEQHLVGGSSPKSFMNDPWISTTTDMNIAKSFNSGEGIIRINLNKLPSNTEIKFGAESLPRTSKGYHYSIWQQEISIKGAIPQKAIKTLKGF